MLHALQATLQRYNRNAHTASHTDEPWAHDKLCTAHFILVISSWLGTIMGNIPALPETPRILYLAIK